MVGLNITCRHARVLLLTQDSYYAPLYTYSVLVPHIQLSSEPYRAAGQLHIIVFYCCWISIRARVVDSLTYTKALSPHSRKT